MQNLCAAAAVSLGLFTASPVFAESIDMATVKCEDFLKSGGDNIAVYLTWLMGYYANEDEETTLDFDKMKESGVKIAAYCKDHPTDGLLDAAEKALNRSD